jgi:hypothetical protein
MTPTMSGLWYIFFQKILLSRFVIVKNYAELYIYYLCKIVFDPIELGLSHFLFTNSCPNI